MNVNEKECVCGRGEREIEMRAFVKFIFNVVWFVMVDLVFCWRWLQIIWCQMNDNLFTPIKTQRF